VEERFDSTLIAGLLALIAHDLRNPLSALQSNVNYIGGAAAGLDREVQEAVEDAVVSCESLGHVVENLELLIHGISQTPQRGLESVAIGPLVEECVASHRGLAASHGMRLELAPPPPGDSLRVTSHRDLLRRALGNLLRNGIQHGQRTPVTVSITVQEASAAVVVADGGVPLDDALGDEVFLARGQLAARNSARGRYGRGLGLYAARVAATLAGADVRPVPPPGGATHAVALFMARA
jgi:signal transduction histidine kinase